jgi:hypothetical protein
MLSVVVVVVMMPLLILPSSASGRRRDVEGLHGEKHLPCQKDGTPVAAEQALAAGAAVEHEGESGKPQEEDDGGGARLSHGHRPGRLQARGVMDDGAGQGS